MFDIHIRRIVNTQVSKVKTTHLSLSYIFRLVGFEGLVGDDDFSTDALRELLLHHGMITSNNNDDNDNNDSDN